MDRKFSRFFIFLTLILITSFINSCGGKGGGGSGASGSSIDGVYMAYSEYNLSNGNIESGKVDPSEDKYYLYNKNIWRGCHTWILGGEKILEYWGGDYKIENNNTVTVTKKAADKELSWTSTFKYLPNSLIETITKTEDDIDVLVLKKMENPEGLSLEELFEKKCNELLPPQARG